MCPKHVEAWNKLIVKQILCIKLVTYWDKYTEMHGQQNVKKYLKLFMEMLVFELFKRFWVGHDKILNDQSGGLRSNSQNWERFKTLRRVKHNCALLPIKAACSGNSLQEITTTRCLISQKSAALMYFAVEAWNLAQFVNQRPRNVD